VELALAYGIDPRVILAMDEELVATMAAVLEELR
jgi:hypothetical protein